MTTAETIAISVLSSIRLMGSREARRVELANLVAEAPDSDLLVLPYLAAYPPFWSVIDRAGGFVYGEREPFPTIDAIAPSIQKRGIRTLATIYSVVAEGVFYATAVLIEADGTSRPISRQEHAVNFDGWHERLYFQPGVNDETSLIDLRGFKFGLLLGGDIWVPETPRLLRMNGAQALISISGAPGTQHENIRALAKARSLENGVPAVWSAQAGSDIEDSTGDSTVSRVTEPWTTFTLNPTAIHKRLLIEDPLTMRRPRRYGALINTWREGEE